MIVTFSVAPAPQDRQRAFSSYSLTVFVGSCVCMPWSDPAEIDDAKAVIELQLDTLAPELQIKELLQEAAYRGQPLGRPHFCRPQDMNKYGYHDYDFSLDW